MKKLFKPLEEDPELPPGCTVFIIVLISLSIAFLTKVILFR